MGKSNAERQAAYRARRAEAGDNGERRLNTWLSTAAALALERLARHHGLTQRALLERLLIEAQDNVTAGFGPDDPERDRFFGVTP
jgi:hypothetical protein